MSGCVWTWSALHISAATMLAMSDTHSNVSPRMVPARGSEGQSKTTDLCGGSQAHILSSSRAITEGSLQPQGSYHSPALLGLVFHWLRSESSASFFLRKPDLRASVRYSWNLLEERIHVGAPKLTRLQGYERKWTLDVKQTESGNEIFQ